jgi:alkanesulfonate monooxygenase SsuD/methylene tetrahydromethanopterin reductase-like flavin-dependent oxidoreductase (luciferase family)
VVGLTHPLRFGVLTPHTVPWPTLVATWRRIEALGFDSVWLGDHVGVPAVPTLPLLEAWTLLAGLAGQTTRIRLGTLVTNVALRHPALLAKQALTVDHLSHGRLELGLGTGYYAEEHHWLGPDFPPPAARIARLGEVVEAVDLLLRQEVTSYHGQYVRLNAAPVAPRPVQHPRPPLTIAAHAPAALTVAARYAETWTSLGGFGVSGKVAWEQTRRRSALVDDACLAQGRDPRTLRRSFLGGFAGDAPFDSLDAFVDFVGRYRELGISEFIVYWLPDDLDAQPRYGAMRGRWADWEMLERVAADELPRLRAQD